MRNKTVLRIAYVFLVLMLITLIAYLVIDYNYKNKNKKNTTTTTTTVVKDKGILDIKDVKSFISYTNKKDNKNEISLKDNSFKKTVIPSDIDNYCGKQYKYNTDIYDVKCDEFSKFVDLILNNKLKFSINLNESETTETTIYESNNYYIVYNAAPMNRLGTLNVYNFSGKHLFSDFIINHNGLKDKTLAIPFIQDNRLYYVSGEYDEDRGFFCAVEYVDFNDDAKTGNFGTYDCNPE